MTKRGWTTELIEDAVINPVKTSLSTNMLNGNTATASKSAKGGYVVVDDITKDIVQISDRLDPSWRVDSRITAPDF